MNYELAAPSHLPEEDIPVKERSPIPDISQTPFIQAITLFRPTAPNAPTKTSWMSDETYQSCYINPATLG